MKDQLIIELFEKRSEEAIRALTDKFGKRSLSIAKKVLTSHEDAEECVNDAYLTVWNNIPPDKPQILEAYLYKIVRNLALKKYRYNTAEKRNSFYDVDLDELCECLESSENVEKILEQKELTDAINAFLAGQKEIDRVIFLKKYWFFMEVNEIAEELDLSVNYVNVHLHRTRKKLRTYMEKNYYE